MHKGWKAHYEKLQKTLSAAPASPPPQQAVAPKVKPEPKPAAVAQPPVVAKEKPAPITKLKRESKDKKKLSLTDNLTSLWKFVKEKDKNNVFLNKV